MRRKMAAGNWKMNGLAADLDVVGELSGRVGNAACEILLCPPATLVHRMAERAKGSAIAVGGQDCHEAESGAHTGDVAATMLRDAGATHVITGHSERRHDHGEDDGRVQAKTRAALDAGLVAIVCVGETLQERDADRTLDVVAGQLAGSLPEVVTAEKLIVAYEPVWAIGTGKTPSTDDIGAVHDFIRARLVRRFGEDTGHAIRILYGGSVKPGNAAEIFAVSNVDGALVGGASLAADDFGPIVEALEGASAPAR